MKSRSRPRPKVRPATRQAEILRRARRGRALEIVQDYVEAIADLVESCGEARAVDLADRLGVTHVTVVRTVARLKRDGYVTTEPYRSIFLTARGQKLAAESRSRHVAVVAFLRRIGVPSRVAELDAEGIEHHVSPQTLAAFRRWLVPRRAAAGRVVPARKTTK